MKTKADSLQLSITYTSVTGQQITVTPVQQIWKGGYAGVPGRGPEGQTCGTCRHDSYYTSSDFHKCGLTRTNWTNGGATDIKVRAPACQFWVADDEAQAMRQAIKFQRKKAKQQAKQSEGLPIPCNPEKKK